MQTGLISMLHECWKPQAFDSETVAEQSKVSAEESLRTSWSGKRRIRTGSLRLESRLPTHWIFQREDMDVKGRIDRIEDD